MNIGIIGVGVVGGACLKGFELLGHNVFAHDPKLNTLLSVVKDTDIVYVCVPTPSAEDGSCDLSIVRDTIQKLENLNYKGLVALKSTSVPGTTEQLISETTLNMCFVPEFLREWCATEDFVTNHEVLVVGCHEAWMYDLVVESHGYFPKNKVMMTPTEAEVLKYYSNVYNALRVVFANAMYEVCDRLGADYEKIKDAYLLRGQSSPHYLAVNEQLRGYGGACLPKDTKALDALVKQLGLDLKLFETIDRDNQQFKRTVIPGMRP